MKYLALILDTEGYWAEMYQLVLKSQGFRTLTAHTPEEALQQATKYYPHVIIYVDSSPARSTASHRHPALDWLMQLDSDLLSYTSTIIISSFASREIIARMVKLGIKEYLLKTIGRVAISKRILETCKRLKQRPLRQDKRNLPAHVYLEGDVIGISETGICVDSHLVAHKPAVGFECSSQIFNEFKTKSPLLRLVNTQAVSSNSFRGFTSYFQIQGWTEKERQNLRAWSLHSRLTPVAVA